MIIKPSSCCEQHRILTLRPTYCALADRAKLYELAELFTDDADCDLGTGQPIHGRAAIRDHFETYAPMAKEWGVLHVLSNPIIDATSADTATGTWYVQQLLASATEPTSSPLLAFGVYHDKYRLERGTWKIQSTRLDELWRNTGA